MGRAGYDESIGGRDTPAEEKRSVVTKEKVTLLLKKLLKELH